MKYELRDSKLKDQGQFFMNGADGNLRKGAVQDWKGWFSVEQSRRYDGMFEENISCSELGKLVRGDIGLLDPRTE